MHWDLLSAGWLTAGPKAAARGLLRRCSARVTGMFGCGQFFKLNDLCILLPLLVVVKRVSCNLYLYAVVLVFSN